MKTNNKNNETRSTPAPSNESIGNDTKNLRKFQVHLLWLQHSHADVFLEASSDQQAYQLARKITVDKVDHWQDHRGGILVDWMATVNGGESHE